MHRKPSLFEMKSGVINNAKFQRFLNWGNGLFLLMSLICIIGFIASQMNAQPPENNRLPPIRERVLPELKKLVEAKNCKVGDPIFIRVFKETKEAELWMQPTKTATWTLVKTYPIATYGGKGIGPKQKEGDFRAPEGFYTVGAKQLNPASNYHLAFNIGYPNDYDTALGRTGSLIMMHGKNLSIGCYAMTDPAIEEIYLLAEAAIRAGQKKFSFHVFPFRMTPERLASESANDSLPFWKQLQAGYDSFETKHIVPEISAEKTGYVIKQ